MRFFRRDPKPTPPPEGVPKAKATPTPKSRFSLWGMFRRKPAAPPDAVGDIPRPPSTSKWRFFRRTPNAQPIIVEVLPETTPPPTGLRRLFSRQPNQTSGGRYFASQLIEITKWSALVIILGLVLIWINDKDNLKPYLNAVFPQSAFPSQATLQAAAALSTRAAIIKTVQAQSTDVFATAAAADRQAVAAEVIMTTRQAAAIGQTATTLAVRQTETAIIMQRSITATQRAVAMNLSAQARTATAVQAAYNSTRWAIMYQATTQAETASSRRPTLPPDCLTPAMVISVLAVAFKLKQTKS